MRRQIARRRPRRRGRKRRLGLQVPQRIGSRGRQGFAACDSPQPTPPDHDPRQQDQPDDNNAAPQQQGRKLFASSGIWPDGSLANGPLTHGTFHPLGFVVRHSRLWSVCCRRTERQRIARERDEREQCRRGDVETEDRAGSHQQSAARASENLDRQRRKSNRNNPRRTFDRRQCRSKRHREPRAVASTAAGSWRFSLPNSGIYRR
jgi:hypothetical protein